jgi:hypothetical protein
MVLVAPDILNEVRQLPSYLLATGVAVGLLLWLFGGRGHRFWLVLALTVAAGVFGLRFGAVYEVQPLVAGLLLAVTAGALALALSRVVLFIAGGAACVALAHAAAPSFDEPAVCFLVGGLLGVLLYKVWVSALSSLAGTLLIAYSILGLLHQLALCNAVAWADGQTPVLNWACGAFAVLGLLTQFLLERRRLRRQREKAEAEKEDEETAGRYPPPPPRPKGWWDWGHKHKSGRRAA